MYKTNARALGLGRLGTLRCRYRDPGYVRTTATGKIVRGGSVSTADVTDCVACGQRRKVSQKAFRFWAASERNGCPDAKSSSGRCPQNARNMASARSYKSHRLRAGRSVYSL